MPQAKRYRFSYDDQELARMGRIIGHPARIKMLQELRTTPLVTFDYLQKIIPLSRPSVSRHLQELIKAGLVLVTAYGDEASAYRLCVEADEELRMRLREFLKG
ncbi:MAG: helix-turn-helix domain-containing protein [Bacteroidota bacterium]